MTAGPRAGARGAGRAGRERCALPGRRRRGGRRPAGSSTSARTGRAWRGLAGGARVLDLYRYTGGFALQAAAVGGAAGRCWASTVRASAGAGGGCPAALNGVERRAAGLNAARAFGTLEKLARPGHERFDIVVADPPAFVKSKKELNQAAARLSQAGPAGGRPGEAGRLPLHRFLLPPYDRRELRRAGGARLGEAARSGRILRAWAGPTIRSIPSCRSRPI